jgi:hypothetical protein
MTRDEAAKLREELIPITFMTTEQTNIRLAQVFKLIDDIVLRDSIRADVNSNHLKETIKKLRENCSQLECLL